MMYLQWFEYDATDIERSCLIVGQKIQRWYVHSIRRAALVHQIRERSTQICHVLFAHIYRKGLTTVANVRKVAQIVHTEKCVRVRVGQNHSVQVVYVCLRERLQSTRPKVLATVYQNIARMSWSNGLGVGNLQSKAQDVSSTCCLDFQFTSSQGA